MDTLHPNSCFCSFSIVTSFMRETTPTSGYKLSHTHIVVQEGPWSVGCVCFGLYLSCLLLKFWIVASILVSSCFVCFWIRGREVSLHSMRACKPLPYGQLTTALVPTVPSPCFLWQSSTVAKVRETFCVSFVLICFVIGEYLSEVGGRVGHGLVLACLSRMCFA